MDTAHSYEDLGYRPPVKPAVCEAYRGTDIVDWHGRIEKQLLDMIGDYEKARNSNYADKLKAFLEIWRENKLDGSINVEDIDSLYAASHPLATDEWDPQNYFMNLRSSLRRLKASEEELPRMNPNDAPPPGGGGGMPGGMFGGEEEPGGALGADTFPPDEEGGEMPAEDDMGAVPEPQDEPVPV